MSARPLTDQETEKLADIVVDPVAWWTHVCNVFSPADAESALALKIANPSHVANRQSRLARGNYKTRAQRDVPRG